VLFLLLAAEILIVFGLVHNSLAWNSDVREILQINQKWSWIGANNKVQYEFSSTVQNAHHASV